MKESDGYVRAVADSFMHVWAATLMEVTKPSRKLKMCRRARMSD
jgi:hypothetical protein